MNELLLRASRDVVVQEELTNKLQSGEKLRIKYGIDPTGERIHIGHAATMRKLAHFQNEGHQIVLIIGSFTGMIGDASDKEAERTILTAEEVKHNMKSYQTMLERILDVEAAEVRYNHEWFEQMRLDEWLRINQLFSVAQMIERDNFSRRFAAESRIGLQEFQYPLLQGYDSVAINADVEIGGTDQLFNLLAGRTLQKAYGQDPQHVITYELLLSDDGRKMSKSWENCIWVDDTPDDMYGKIMRINDELIMHYFELCTDLSNEELTSIDAELSASDNPRDIKARLAREIVTIFHTTEAAQQAEERFIDLFRHKNIPEDITEVTLEKEEWSVDELLVYSGLLSSKSEARRLMRQGGVKRNGEKIDADKIVVEHGDILQAGKRRFVKLILS